MEKQATKKRTRRVLLIALSVLCAFFLYLLAVRLFGFGIPCIIYEVTGIRCAACGLTRALVAFSRGGFAEGLALNPLAPLYLLYGIWLAASLILRYIRGSLDDRFLPRPLWLHLALLTLALAFMVWRNL